MNRKPLVKPEKRPAPDVTKIVCIVLEYYHVTKVGLASYLDVSVETVNRLKNGRKISTRYPIVSGLKELALANFDIEQLEECGVI